MLARTLRLVMKLEELTLTNKVLREQWKERREAVFILIGALLVTPPGSILI